MKYNITQPGMKNVCPLVHARLIPHSFSSNETNCLTFSPSHSSSWRAKELTSDRDKSSWTDKV